MTEITDIGTCFEELRDNVRFGVNVGSKLDEDGVDIYFLNNPQVYKNVTTPTDVKMHLILCQLGQHL